MINIKKQKFNNFIKEKKRNEMWCINYIISFIKVYLFVCL